MRYYLYLLLVAVCEARRITRGVDYTEFPHFRTVYHGHGATSYQSVQMDNHNSIPVPANYGNHHADIQDIEHHVYHQPELVPIIESHDDVDHIDISDSVPYEEYVIADVELKPDLLEHYFDHYDEGHEYLRASLRDRQLEIK